MKNRMMFITMKVIMVGFINNIKFITVYFIMVDTNYTTFMIFKTPHLGPTLGF